MFHKKKYFSIKLGIILILVSKIILVFGSILNQNFGRNQKIEWYQNRNGNFGRNPNFGRNRYRNPKFLITTYSCHSHLFFSIWLWCKQWIVNSKSKFIRGQTIIDWKILKFRICVRPTVRPCTAILSGIGCSFENRSFGKFVSVQSLIFTIIKY